VQSCHLIAFGDVGAAMAAVIRPTRAVGQASRVLEGHAKRQNPQAGRDLGVLGHRRRVLGGKTDGDGDTISIPVLNEGSGDPGRCGGAKGVAFEMARAALRSDRSGAVTEILALKIIELANEGVLDPDRLCAQALSGFRTSSSLEQPPRK
jgi:hypothetical protein